MREILRLSLTANFRLPTVQRGLFEYMKEIYSIPRQKKVITKRRNVHRDRFMVEENEHLNNQTMLNATVGSKI